MSEKITVAEFITKTRNQKIEQLMGITMDKEYFVAVIGDDDEEALRDQLAEEQQKVVKEKDRILKDDRDIDKINALTKRIDTVVKAKQELQNLKEMENGIRKYLGIVDNPGAGVTKTLDDISKM